MESEKYQEFITLCQYHEIVGQFLSNTKHEKSSKDHNYILSHSHISELRNRFSNLLGVPYSELLQDDILSCPNPFQLLLYLALSSQWDLLDKVSEDTLTDPGNYPIFQSNLQLFSSQEFYDVMTDLTLSEEARSLLKTLAIYFYIRVPGACFLSMKYIFNNFKNNPPARISQSDNSYCLEFYRSLISSSLVSEAFSVIDSSVSLDDLFSRVCNSSYYAVFPSELYGLTTIGDIVFVNGSFSINNSIYQAATVVTLLRESAHLIQRYRRDQNSYLVVTPKKCKSRGIKYNREMGDFVENLIFGQRMELINSLSGDFLLNRNNWDLSKEEFQRRLIAEYEDGKNKGKRDTRVGKGNTGSYLHRGRCGMAVNIC